jgi:hypothetical protein
VTEAAAGVGVMADGFDWYQCEKMRWRQAVFSLTPVAGTGAR